MSIEPANIESLTHAPAGGDLLRHLEADGWKRWESDKHQTAWDRINIRLADLQEDHRRRQAELRERCGILLAVDVPLDDGTFDDGVPLDPEYLRAAREEDARRREAVTPTVDHRPTVILIDKDGSERLITEPLPDDERWQCTAYDENKRIAWDSYFLYHDEAVEESAAASKERLEARKVEEADKKANPKPKKVKLDKNGNVVPMPDHVMAKLEAPKMHRRKVAKRLQEYDSNGPRISSDRRRLPFKESFRNSSGIGTALRSRLGVRGLQLFSSRLPKEALVGWDKRGVFVGTTLMEPIFVRDMDYVTIGWWTVRGQIVADLDRNFTSLRVLRRELMRVLGPALMPTLIVYSLTAEGEIEGPHLIWILPPNSEVGICGQSKAAPIRTFEMVQQAVVSALIELGADCGHENTGKIKNPLSPKWHVACEETFPDLADFIRELPTVATNKREMRRRQARLQNKTVEEMSESQHRFQVSKDIFLDVRAKARKANDRAYKDSLATPTLHAQWLKRHATPRVIQALGDTKEVRRLLAQHIEFWSGKRPSPKSKAQYEGDNRFRDRGLQRDLGLVGAVRPDDRKAQGLAKKSLAAIETNRGFREKSLATMDEQIGLFQRSGGDLEDRAAVIAWIRKGGKLGKSTVYDLVDVAISLFRAASRYIATPCSPVKPPILIPASTLQVSVPSAPVVTTLSIVSGASAATSPGKPGHDHKPPSCRVAEHPSSAQARRLRGPAEPLATVTSTTGLPAEHASPWLRVGGHRVLVETDSLQYGNHDTIQ
ncbi:hypothetical protein [Bradyrhizobium sp. WYCCWR 12699]|uniref:hypothetical protein n=1 Tax=Bradyrhizobium sp. WYCCWR 12699 TaxID=3064203 RepID=UPI0028A50C3F|nr:hypothetical protein [Bradyrhizobium sp. WYCCWR 12699]MDT4740253.1 hypothetical protein [Bradyrhizobium sp. WYCCWR 12699]